MHASPLVSCLLIGADNSSRYRKQYSGANTADSQVHDTLSAANTAVTANIQVHDISHTSFASQTEGSTFNDGCLPKTSQLQQTFRCMTSVTHLLPLRLRAALSTMDAFPRPRQANRVNCVNAQWTSMHFFKLIIC